MAERLYYAERTVYGYIADLASNVSHAVRLIGLVGRTGRRFSRLGAICWSIVARFHVLQLHFTGIARSVSKTFPGTLLCKVAIVVEDDDVVRQGQMLHCGQVSWMMMERLAQSLHSITGVTNKENCRAAFFEQPLGAHEPVDNASLRGRVKRRKHVVEDDQVPVGKDGARKSLED